jgi:hypothetical protein
VPGRAAVVGASPITKTRCAFVLLATATHILPVRRAGSPPPVISFHVTPPSTDLKIFVLVGPVCGPPRPPPPPNPPAGGVGDV